MNGVPDIYTWLWAKVDALAAGQFLVFVLLSSLVFSRFAVALARKPLNMRAKATHRFLLSSVLVWGGLAGIGLVYCGFYAGRSMGWVSAASESGLRMTTLMSVPFRAAFLVGAVMNLDAIATNAFQGELDELSFRRRIAYWSAIWFAAFVFLTYSIPAQLPAAG